MARGDAVVTGTAIEGSADVHEGGISARAGYAKDEIAVIRPVGEEKIVVVAAAQVVGAPSALQSVGAGLSEQVIAPRPAQKDVAARTAEQRVVAVASLEGVVSRAELCFGPAVAVQDVVSRSADEVIVPVAAEEIVVPAAAVERVVAVGTVHRVVDVEPSCPVVVLARECLDRHGVLHPRKLNPRSGLRLLG